MAGELTPITKVRVPEEKWDGFMQAVLENGVVVPGLNDGNPVYFSPRSVLEILNTDWTPANAAYVHGSEAAEFLQKEAAKVAIVRTQFSGFLEEVKPQKKD